MPRLTMPRLGGLSEGAPAASSPSANPNLLLWSEELDRALTWVPTLAVVIADQALDSVGLLTAESIAFSLASSKLAQAVLPATTGSLVTTTVTLSGAWQRASVTGTFDSTPYIFSGEFLDNGSGGADIQMRMLISGGNLVCDFRDTGDGAFFYAARMKLETPSLTDYVKREGV